MNRLGHVRWHGVWVSHIQRDPLERSRRVKKGAEDRYSKRALKEYVHGHRK